MKKEKIKQLFGRKLVKAGSVMLAAAVVIGSSMWYENRQIQVPELVSYVDMEEQIQVIEEDVPLAVPKVTKSVKTTKSTKKVKMNKKSNKTYSKKGSTKKKTVTKKQSTTDATTTTKTEKATTVTSKYKKGSYIKTELTTVKTTVTKTVVEKEAEKAKNNSNNANNTEQETQSKAGMYAASALAPKADRRLLEAYEKLGFKVTVTPNVPYSGYFSSRDQMITVRKADSTVYHELGHFLGFIAGNIDSSGEFKAVFENEKSKYTANNKQYVLSNSAEYFAESYLNYVENPAALRAERPQTFAAIEAALNMITTDRVDKIWKVYSVIWSR